MTELENIILQLLSIDRIQPYILYVYKFETEKKIKINSTPIKYFCEIPEYIQWRRFITDLVKNQYDIETSYNLSKILMIVYPKDIYIYPFFQHHKPAYGEPTINYPLQFQNSPFFYEHLRLLIL